ncbi:MAG: 2-dehydropantoate 2-reductase [Rhodospirillales bacterium]|nr:2-dehydropantoate 2-reductase [Rhodospirillales bacterium]
MKIVIFGSGGVGGYFGARLAASGEDVHFIARGGHLKAMREEGLRVKSPLEDAHVAPVTATDTVTDCGVADVVFVAVKLYDTDAAADAIKPAVGPDTTLVSFQNGVSGGDILSAAFGRERVIGGSSSIAARIAKPGVIEHTGTMAMLAIGEWDGLTTPRVQELYDACVKAGIDTTLSDHIDTVIWSKFIFLAAFSGITCTYRQSIGPIREDAEKRALFRAGLEETCAVARARGVSLPENLIDKRMQFTDGLPAEMYSSMYHDLMADKRLELAWLSGAVVDFGRELGIKTPAHQGFVDALAPYADGKP